MATQLLSVPRIRRAVNISSYDIAVKLSLSHSQNSYYHGIGDDSAAKAQVSEGHHSKNERPRRSQRRGLLEKSRGLTAKRLNRFLHRFQESSSSYIFRSVKAFYIKMASINSSSSSSSSSSNGVGREVMAVEPYFSMPVVPVTTTVSLV